MMSAQNGTHIYWMGDEQIELPEGVSLAEWALEQRNWQNPRIRAFLGCTQLLAGVMESNYAILHCSPERLIEIWRKVQEVVRLIRNDVAPLLRAASVVPRLEDARQGAAVALEMLDENVLERFEQIPDQIEGEQMIEVRKLLCVSMGELHAFLQDTFGSLMAADPRAQYDADYFLSRRFPQDIEEAEWLHGTVKRLADYLHSLEQGRALHLADMAGNVRREGMLPSRQRWSETKIFLEVLVEKVTPKIKEVLALRGVRFYEMEILDRYAVDIPTRCQTILELWQTGREAAESIKAESGANRSQREQSVQDLMSCHSILSRRLSALLMEVNRAMQDLMAFLPLWLQGIERRRALLLRRGTNGQGPSIHRDSADTAEMEAEDSSVSFRRSTSDTQEVAARLPA
jgi:hypothetical protein